MRLPKVDGLTLFRRLREESPDTDVIVMTGNAAVADAVAVLKEGAFDYLTKPFDLDELGVQLQRLATFRALRRDVAATRTELTARPSSREQLVGHSPGCSSCVKRMETIAHSDAAVRHHGRERHRQGAGRARAPRGERAPGEAVRGGQLRARSPTR